MLTTTHRAADDSVLPSKAVPSQSLLEKTKPVRPFSAVPPEDKRKFDFEKTRLNYWGEHLVFYTYVDRKKDAHFLHNVALKLSGEDVTRHLHPIIIEPITLATQELEHVEMAIFLFEFLEEYFLRHKSHPFSESTLNILKGLPANKSFAQARYRALHKDYDEQQETALKMAESSLSVFLENNFAEDERCDEEVRRYIRNSSPTLDSDSSSSSSDSSNLSSPPADEKGKSVSPPLKKQATFFPKIDERVKRLEQFLHHHPKAKEKALHASSYRRG